MNKKTRNSIIIASLFLIFTIPIIADSALAKQNEASDKSKPEIIAVLGKGNIQGEPAIVEVLVEVQSGENPDQIAQEVLNARNLKPFTSSNLGSDGFEVTGFYWPTHSLTQHYNTNNEEVDTSSILSATHADWNGVNTSDFIFSKESIPSTNCPSMVRECPGPQVFDFENTVGWVSLKDRGVLAVAYFATHSINGPETDIAINTKYAWNDNCNEDVEGRIDVETVLRHETGHAAGIGHSQNATALMAPYYSGPNCDLDHDDDKEAITYLYDSDGGSSSLTGFVLDADNIPIEGATVKLAGTDLEATTDENGSYVISNIPDPVTYDITASADGFDSQTSLRVLFSGGDTITIFNLSSSTSDGGGDGGGGPPECHPRFGC